MSLVEARGLAKTYYAGTVEVQALRGLDFDIEDGELLAIMGRSGSGKTTLLNILGCVERPTAGTYFLAGENIGTLNDAQRSTLRLRRLGFVFQSYNLLSGMSALDNVMLPTVYSGLEDAVQRAQEALERVGLAGREHHRPNQLSGGEQQRVAIARALAKRPDVLLCDEPTGALDYATGKVVLEALRDVNKKTGTSVITITHNAAIGEMGNRVVSMLDGRVREERTNDHPVSPDQLEW